MSTIKSWLTKANIFKNSYVKAYLKTTDMKSDPEAETT